MEVQPFHRGLIDRHAPERDRAGPPSDEYPFPKSSVWSRTVMRRMSRRIFGGTRMFSATTLLVVSSLRLDRLRPVRGRRGGRSKIGGKHTNTLTGPLHRRRGHVGAIQRRHPQASCSSPHRPDGRDVIMSANLGGTKEPVKKKTGSICSAHDPSKQSTLETSERLRG